MKFAKPKVTPEATFDLTNMIDVVLLLIIFFMLTAQFTKSNLAPINLPVQKGEEGSPTSDRAVVIDLKSDGTLQILGETMRLDRLQQAVLAGARADESAGRNVEVLIRAERTCPATHLNALTTALAQINIRRWKLATSGEGS